MNGNAHFSEVLMTNRNNENNQQDMAGTLNSIASFPMSAKPHLNRFRSVSPPSTGDSSSSSGSGSISSVINRNFRYFVINLKKIL